MSHPPYHEGIREKFALHMRNKATGIQGIKPMKFAILDVACWRVAAINHSADKVVSLLFFHAPAVWNCIAFLVKKWQ